MASVITLVSSDDRKFEIPIKSGRLSVFVTNTLNLEDVVDDETLPTAESEVKCLNVDGTTLERVTAFLKHYPGNEFEKITTESFIKPTFAENVPEKDTFYVKFMDDINADTPNGISDDIYRLKDAANYMDIQSLLELICLFQTSQIEKCKNTNEIMKMLRIPPFKNEEEEEMYRTECHWMFRNPTSS
jgi:Skp1 family, tetramerisation domain